MREEVLIIGCDVTWWGGSWRDRASQHETFFWTVLGRDGIEIRSRVLKLRDYPNPDREEPDQANFDRRGGALFRSIKSILDEETGVSRTILAFDSPLEAQDRALPRRKKVPGPDEVCGRQADHALSSGMRKVSSRLDRDWSSIVNIQPGAPIPPRIASVVELLSRLGFQLTRDIEDRFARQLIEVFPSEALFSVGALGCYGEKVEPARVKRYKLVDQSLSLEDARLEVKAILGGFRSLHPMGVGPHAQLVDLVIDASRQISGTSVVSGKALDDPIESAIAFLTATAFAEGCVHDWGDGSDGYIVGPGDFSQRRPQRTVEIDWPEHEGVARQDPHRCCPACGKKFQSGRRGWDGHVGSPRACSFRPEIRDPETRKRVFRDEYPGFFR